MDAPLCKGKGASNSMLWDSAISIECVQVCKKTKPGFAVSWAGFL
jgi:hypothetical protein